MKNWGTSWPGSIPFFPQPISDTPQLAQFIGRTLTFKAPDEERVVSSDWAVSVSLCTLQRSTRLGSLVLAIGPTAFVCGAALAWVCSWSLPQSLISVVECLYILNQSSQLCWKNDNEEIQWLTLLQTFIAVKSLYIHQGFAPHIAPTLQEVV